MSNAEKTKPRILVIDDDQVILDLFRENLSDLSLDVVIKNNAKDALLLNFNQIDCIVTDIMMPGMTGVEFMQQLEKLGHKKMLFFMTGYHDFPREELNKFNPKAIIFKPFDVEEAALLIKNHIMRIVK